MEFIVDSKSFGKITADISSDQKRRGSFILIIHLNGQRIRGAAIAGKAQLEETNPNDHRCTRRFGTKWQADSRLRIDYLYVKKESDRIYSKLYSDSFYERVREMIMTVVEFVEANEEKLKKEVRVAEMRSRYYWAGKEIKKLTAQIESLEQEQAELFEKLDAASAQRQAS